MYNRHLENKIHKSMQFSPATLIVGSRQCGKTTLVQAIKNQNAFRYLSFDDLSLLQSAKADPSQFFKFNPPPLILDEIQRTPELFLPMKLSVDNNRSPNMFLLTGSANPLMLPNLGDSLAGRMVIHHLWPLSQGELINHKENFLQVIFADDLPHLDMPPLTHEDLFQKIRLGGFPTMQTLPDDESRSLWLNGYLQTILEKDVRDLAQIEKLHELPHMLELLATRPGELLNYVTLANACNIPRSTLTRYFQYMQTLFAIHPLRPWLANRGKRLIKSPKVYFNDTGILCHLLHLSSNSTNIPRELLGKLIENFIVVELQKQLSYSESQYDLYFYRDHVGNEIDLVIEGPQKQIVAIEIKSTATIKTDFFKTISSFAKDLGPRFKRGIVLYTGDKALSYGPNLIALPIQSLWQY